MTRIFDSPGKSKCEICETSHEESCVLIPVDGTEGDGVEEAKIVHLSCLLSHMRWSPRPDDVSSEHKAIIYGVVD